MYNTYQLYPGINALLKRKFSYGKIAIGVQRYAIDDRLKKMFKMDIHYCKIKLL